MDFLACIRSIRAVLDGVRVEGRDNMMKLLTCMATLDKMEAALTKGTAKENQNEGTDPV